MPWRAAPDHRVEDAEQAAHAGDQGDLLGASAIDQGLVMPADHRVPADRRERRHEQHVAHIDPATGDGAPAAHLSGVAIDGSNTDESGDTTAVELTEFGQIGDQGMGRDVADAGN